MKQKQQDKKLLLSKTTIARLDQAASRNLVGGIAGDADTPTTVITSVFGLACETNTSCGLYACITTYTSVVATVNVQ